MCFNCCCCFLSQNEKYLNFFTTFRFSLARAHSLNFSFLSWLPFQIFAGCCGLTLDGFLHNYELNQMYFAIAHIRRLPIRTRSLARNHIVETRLKLFGVFRVSFDVIWCASRIATHSTSNALCLNYTKKRQCQFTTLHPFDSDQSCSPQKQIHFVLSLVTHKTYHTIIGPIPLRHVRK